MTDPLKSRTCIIWNKVDGRMILQLLLCLSSTVAGLANLEDIPSTMDSTTRSNIPESKPKATTINSQRELDASASDDEGKNLVGKISDPPGLTTTITAVKSQQNVLEPAATDDDSRIQSVSSLLPEEYRCDCYGRLLAFGTGIVITGVISLVLVFHIIRRRNQKDIEVAPLAVKGNMGDNVSGSA